MRNGEGCTARSATAAPILHSAFRIHHSAFSDLGPGLLLLLLAACTPAGAAETPPPAADVRPLTFWHIQNYRPTQPVIEAAWGRVVAAHPDWRLAPPEALANDAFKEKLNLALSSGRLPDVFHTWGGEGLARLARAGMLLDLSARLAAEELSRFQPAALALGRSGGRLYALPTDVSVVVLWYNRKILEEHGLAPPRDFAALLELCRKLSAAGVTPLALGNSKQWPGAFYYDYLATRLAPPGYLDRALRGEAGARLDGAPFVRAGELLQELVRAGAFAPGHEGREVEAARAEFFRGAAALTLDGTWLLAQAQSKAPELLASGALGAVPFPAVAGGEGEPTAVLAGINAAWTASAAGPNPAAAVALLRELTSDETCAAWEETGRLSALRPGNDPAAAAREARINAAFPGRAEALAVLRQARELQLYYDQLLPGRLAELHKQTVQGLFLERDPLAPAEAAGEMAEEADRLRESGLLPGAPAATAATTPSGTPGPAGAGPTAAGPTWKRWLVPATFWTLFLGMLYWRFRKGWR